MIRIPDWIRKNPVLPWGALFVAICLSVTQYGGMNALSRLAALRAITEGHTFNINNYRDWTIDWALSKNGNYYSNKAPGPVFLALPIFALADAIALPLNAKNKDEKGRAPAPGYAHHLLLILWLQIVPFFLLVLWICWRLQAAQAPPLAIHFFALASFFGNTAAIYMSSNFGHGLAAMLFLAAYFFWYERKYIFVGLFIAFSLLSDYGVTFALPFFIIATIWRERNWKSLFSIGIGAAPAGLLWIWYHTVAFGSPFATANQFINPEQLEKLPDGSTFSPIPLPSILFVLLFGTSRGLLFTQPWSLAVFLLPFLRKRERGLTLLTVGSLFGVLWMNAGFAGWHAGWCVGPRYISAVLPAMALGLALAWPELPPWMTKRLIVLLAVALIFRLLVFPFSNLAPETDLWQYHFQKYMEAKSLTPFARLVMALAFSAAALYWQKRRFEFPFSAKSA